MSIGGTDGWCLCWRWPWQTPRIGIELLCKMYQALLRFGTVGTAGPTGFQTASDVSSEWNGMGSYRLREDLRACIWAMEGCSMRWARG